MLPAEETVSVEATAVVPVTLIEAGVKEQVGAGVPPPVTLQETVTVPV
jgi:hypothetical protein